MWPCLFGGVVLALLALVLAAFTARGAAVTCLAACVGSVLGVVLAWGVNAEATIRGLVVPIGLLSLPALCAVDLIRKTRRDRKATGASSKWEGAG